VKYSISIESCVYPETPKELVGFTEADSMQDAVKKLEIDVRRLALLFINVYFSAVREIEFLVVPPINSFGELLSAIEKQKGEWDKKYNKTGYIFLWPEQ